MAKRKIPATDAGIVLFALYGIATTIWSMVAELPAALRGTGTLAAGVALLALLFRNRSKKEE